MTPTGFWVYCESLSDSITLASCRRSCLSGEIICGRRSISCSRIALAFRVDVKRVVIMTFLVSAGVKSLMSVCWTGTGKETRSDKRNLSAANGEDGATADENRQGEEEEQAAIAFDDDSELGQVAENGATDDAYGKDGTEGGGA